MSQSYCDFEKVVRQLVSDVFPIMDEKTKRLIAGSLARGYGYGGQKLVSKYTGCSQQTLCRAVAELESGYHTTPEAIERIRQPGAGRKSIVASNPGLVRFIDEFLQKNTYGNPESVLCYTALSLREIANIVGKELSIAISRNIVSKILDDLGYSKQRNQKMEQVGEAHPNRNEQFEHINETGARYIREGNPFISVDCKKKENIGNFINPGQEYRRKCDPRHVLDHDFPLKELGKVAPYGIYTVNDNTGFINLGKSKDTAEFAVASIRGWWCSIGRHTFPDAKKIYISADGGGSNGSKNRLWKLELAKLAQETGLEIEVSHFPPGTSKWNKVEHRLFSYISKNWQGKPLIDIMTVVKLIGSTTTSKGLKVTCEVDEHIYKTGIKVENEHFDKIDIEFFSNMPAWNYIIRGFKN